MKKVALIMGSASDSDVVKKGYALLESFGVPTEVRVISAHRTPQIACEFAAQARDNGYGVIIGCAGKAAHLAGIIAAHTTLPVIGLPISSSFMDGLDSLLSTVQMPSGVPVATVAVNGAENAALLAVQMLALEDEELSVKLSQYKQNLKDSTIEADANVKAKMK